MNLTELDIPQTVHFTLGRFNPPTLGHKKLLDMVAGQGTDYFIFPTKTHDSKKNPLQPQKKMGYLIDLFPEHSNYFIMDKSVRTVIEAMNFLQNKGYTKAVMVVGSDRVNAFQKLLNDYNGKDYTFKEIEVKSAGERDPDADDVSGASASKAREAAQANDYATFAKMIPGGDSDTAKKLFADVKKGMNIQEAETEVDKEQKPIVYLDMDGVLADFFAALAKFSGVAHWKQLDKAELQSQLDKMVGTDFFANIPKTKTCDTIVKMAVTFAGKYSINSSPLRNDNKNSGEMKKVWIRKNLSPQPETIIITGRKESYAVKNGVPNILIDDRPANLEKWKARGGYAIRYQADEDSLDVIVNGFKNYGKESK